LSKRVKAKERAARALTRLVKPMTIASGFCVSGTITKSRPRPLARLEKAPFVRSLMCNNQNRNPDLTTKRLHRTTGLVHSGAVGEKRFREIGTWASIDG
jgi:hypothetical protein